MLVRASLFAPLYRTTRSCVLGLTYLGQKLRKKPRNLEPAIVFGDEALAVIRKTTGPLLKGVFPKTSGVDLYDVHFPSPITFAAFKDDFRILTLWLEMGLGGGLFKSVMRDIRPGNPQPRIQDVGPNLLNAMGMPSKGIDKFAESLKHHPIFQLNKPLGVSVGGNSVEEYLSNLQLIEARLPDVKFYEVNISCPNTPEGQNLTTHLDLLENLLRDLRASTSKVIGVKVSPDQSNEVLRQIGEIVKALPKTYINAGNTTFRKCAQVGLPDNAISIGGGGFSGPALFPRTLEMVKLYSEFGIPILATGGITTAADAKAVKEAGATLIGVATVLVKDPFSIAKIQAAF